jgi:hypothetical protein
MGILVSMAHYHSEGLECLDHANEEHYAESDPVCPVCTIVAYTDSGESLDVSHLLEYQETLVAVQELLIADDIFTPLLGRAPPALI